MTFAKIESALYREGNKKVPDSEILDYMLGQGMTGTPRNLVYDGQIHRFATNTEKISDDAGWYSAFMTANGTKVICFGDFRLNLSLKYAAGMKNNMSENERLEMEYEIEQRMKQAADERKRYHDENAKKALAIWNSLPSATTENGYLKRKNVLPHGAKQAQDGRLVVPLYNVSGDLRSIQYIPSAEGEKKRFLTGTEAKGCFWWLGDPDATKVFLCEGFATASSIIECTGSTVFMAFMASGLASVAKMLTEHGKIVTVVADNDEAGVKGAEACEGCQVVIIPTQGEDANDYQNRTGELREILPDLAVQSKMILADDILTEDLTVSWLIKGWIPSGSIGMIHGPSASGKTTIMLDMLLSASSGMSGWIGNRIIRPVNVVYLCGEGLIGVKRRLRAWKSERAVDSLGNFAVYPLPLDLDKPEGIREIRIQIDTLGWRPDVIVVDTVNRYMSGDENSAQDTRMLLNCVDSLRSRYSCSGLYVHHTGNSEETQKRARGSSAWRGALDYEISVSVDPDSNVRCVEQVKMKDTELMPKVYGVIEGADIPGVFDDEGEQVTGAVFNPVDEPESKSDSAASQAVDLLFRVYTEKKQSNRRINKTAFREWLVENGKASNDDNARKWLGDKRKDRPMGKLLSSGILTPEGDGWYIHDTPETHMVLGLLDKVKT